MPKVGSAWLATFPAWLGSAQEISAQTHHYQLGKQRIEGLDTRQLMAAMAAIAMTMAAMAAIEASMAAMAKNDLGGPVQLLL